MHLKLSLQISPLLVLLWLEVLLSNHVSGLYNEVDERRLEIVSHRRLANERLGQCEGDCDDDDDCMDGLYCFHRDGYEKVPGCNGGEEDSSRSDYCIRKKNDDSPRPSPTKPPSTEPPVTSSDNDDDLLGECEGDCDDDDDCKGGLFCFKRDPFEDVPGCMGGDVDSSRSDYCIKTKYRPDPPPPPPPPQPTPPPTPRPNPRPTPYPTPSPTALLYTPPRPTRRPIPGRPSQRPPRTPSPTSSPTVEPLPLEDIGNNPLIPLSRCQGDCDNDSDCEGDLVCFQREHGNETVPGCIGTGYDWNDFCVDPGSFSKAFIPGKLTTRKLGIILSQGLDAILVATSGEMVTYANDRQSEIPFHFMPDGGATFPDFREVNKGGWIYVSNSEMKEKGEGGVGAFTFDSVGNLLDYRMVLEGTTMNCGGGRTPWHTWASCEEDGSDGKVYQVDPTGERDPEVMTIGSWGGRWESFAYDVRNRDKPHFFITEDKEFGPLVRFTPDNPDWDDPWNILHGEGVSEFLKLTVDGTGDAGTFSWTTDRASARQNAKNHYPESEGIDVHKSQLFFVCKNLKMIYTLELDEGTWNRVTTESGLFDGHPDQMQRLLGSTSNLLYFTEEGGKNAGIHARDGDARFYTIMESTERQDESTGLSLSPNGIFMYVAMQDEGMLYALFRRDGKPFEAEHLDVKYHRRGYG